jgi:hypothetical protein
MICESASLLDKMPICHNLSLKQSLIYIVIAKMTVIEATTAQRQCRVIMKLLSAEAQKFCGIEGCW